MKSQRESRGVCIAHAGSCDQYRTRTIRDGIQGKKVTGYREEQEVNPNRRLRLLSPAFVYRQLAMGRRSGLHARGKTTTQIGTEISIHFKKAPPVLFNKDLRDLNVLVIRIQPDEGISLRIQAKIPGTSLRIEPVKMDFHYGTSFGKPSPEAYERLLLDAMSGDATLLRARRSRTSLGFY